MLPGSGHEYMQNCSSAPLGQSAFPSHSWDCVMHFEVSWQNTEGLMQAGWVDTLEGSVMDGPVMGAKKKQKKNNEYI